jgi:hypothetical protein
MKRIRSKIEEGNLTEKKLEHREPKCQTKQKPNKNYVLPNKVICFTKQNTDFFIRYEIKMPNKTKTKQKLCFTKQSNMFYQTKILTFLKKDSFSWDRLLEFVTVTKTSTHDSLWKIPFVYSVIYDLNQFFMFS